MNSRLFKHKNIRSEFAQGFCEQAEWEFLTWLDQVESHGEVIKRDKKAVLVQAKYAQFTIIVKHYPYVGFIHALGHAITQSRAQYTWQSSLRMAQLNVPTPQALACVERFKCGIVHDSYFVYAYEDGFRFREYAWNTPVDTLLSEPHWHNVYAVLKSLKHNQITHGDLKMPNIIITEHGPTLIDLDQVRFHTSKRAFRKRRLRDLKRFRRELPWNR